MRSRNFLSKFRLSYQNPTEEHDYLEFKTPLIKDLCIWLFVFIALLFIPLTYRYISKNLYPQVEIGATFILLAIIIFIFRRRLQKYLQFISVLYLALILVLYITNMRLILGHQKPYEAFYMGYGFALIQRMLDYRISKFPLFIAFNVLFTILKFALVTIPDVALGALVVCLEVFPMIISFKVETAERGLFDSFHKSKTQLLKFKTLLTEYFPNQMAVLSHDCSDMYFVNDSFKRSFKCESFSQLQRLFHKLDIDSESIDQNSELFELLETKENDKPIKKTKTFKLSKFLELLPNKIKEIGTYKAIGLQIHQEDETEELENSDELRQNRSSEKERPLFKNTRAISYTMSKSHRPGKNHNVEFYESAQQQESQNRMKPQREQNENQSMDLIDIEQNNFKMKINSEADESPVAGKTIWKATIFPLLWDNNDAIAVILDDITYERTILELEIADRNKDMVMAMVSHELRTPLNGMLGMLDIVEKRLKSAEVETQSEVFYYLDAFRINSQFLLNLVNSILDFSQFKNNKLKLDYSQVNIHELFEKIRPLFDHFCKTKNLYLNIHIERNVPQTIVTDHGRLSQVLINLIGNAFKFTFNGGVTIRVSLEDENPCKVRISVEDTGIGIKKEDVEKLFQLFGRLEEHKKINAQGVGLGLMLSNTLAKLLDPKKNSIGIEVMSEFGKGSMFTFTVESKARECKSIEGESLINEQAESLTIQEKMKFYSHRGKERSDFSLLSRGTSLENIKKNIKEKTKKPWCLIVDDNPFNIIVAEHLMQCQGYQVVTALNGKDAIEKVQEHQKKGHLFRIILMDCEMPVMNGYEATKTLVGMMKNGEVFECPIIAVSAHINDDRQKRLYEEAEMSGYVSKPLQKDKLEEILKKFQKDVKDKQ